jgi:hypothetical protein
MNAYYARRRRKTLLAFATKVASRRLQGDRLTALVERVCKQFGGVEGLTRVWVNELRLVLVQEPGSRFALRSLEAVAWLIAAAEEGRQREEREVGQLSDEELEAEVRAIMERQSGRGPE